MADERTPLLGAPAPASKARTLKLQAAATLGASLLGTGILAQPRACSSTGLVAFGAISVVALVLSHLTAMMLCRTAAFLNATSPVAPTSYSDVVAIVLGRKGELFTMWIITLMQIGCSVGYVVVIGDVFTPLIRHWTHHSSQPTNVEVIALVSLLVLTPLCVAVRKLGSLRYTSAIAMLVIMFFAGVVIGNAIYVLSSPDPWDKRADLMGQDAIEEDDMRGPSLWPLGWEALRAVPLICFAYFMHFNVIPVFRTLADLRAGAEAAYASASRLSFLLSGSVTAAFGVFGYLTFLDMTESDILSNFYVSGTYISSFLNVVRAFYGVGLILAFPVVLWEARENLKRIIFGGDVAKGHSASGNYSPMALEEFSVLDETTTSYDERNASSAVPLNPDTSLRDSFRVHAIISVSLVLLTATIGALVTNLEVVFGLVGSTCTPVIAYILPATVYIKSGAAAKREDVFVPRVALAVGTFLVPFGLTVWILTRLGRL